MIEFAIILGCSGVEMYPHLNILYVSVWTDNIFKTDTNIRHTTVVYFLFIWLRLEIPWDAKNMWGDSLGTELASSKIWSLHHKDHVNLYECDANTVCTDSSLLNACC